MRTLIFSGEHCGEIKWATHAKAQYTAAVVHMQAPYVYVLCEGYDTSIVRVSASVL